MHLHPGTPVDHQHSVDPSDRSHELLAQVSAECFGPVSAGGGLHHDQSPRFCHPDKLCQVGTGVAGSHVLQSDQAQHQVEVVGGKPAEVGR